MNIIAELPESLRRLLIAPVPQGDATKVSAANGYPAEGKRNATLTSIAGIFRRRGMEQDDLSELLSAYNEKLPDPLPRAEVEGIARSVSRYPEVPEFSEQTMSDVLAERHGDRLRYSIHFGWMHYNGTHWQRDTKGLHVQERVKELINAARDWIENRRGLDSEDRKALAKAARALRKRAANASIAQLAKSHPQFLDEDPWDDAPEKLNFRNGTLDLVTFELKSHDPLGRITRVLPYEFDAEATCPNFDQLLGRVLDPEVAQLLLRLLGYALRGTGEEQLLAMLIGVGRNGKTTLVNAVAAALGSYASAAEPTTFTKAPNKPSINNDVACLAGARLITTSELNTGQQLDTALVKRMTGAETLKARFLHCEFFEFTLKGLVVMTTNFAPVFDGSDFAMARRLLAIPFQQIIPENEVDPYLPQRLTKEAPGIMNRLIEGLRAYRSGGIQIPKSVGDATSAYVRDSNQVGLFLEERCDVDPSGAAKGRASEIYAAYQGWAYSERSTKPMSMPAFNKAMERTLSLTQQRDNRGRLWPGVTLKKTQAA